MVVEEDQVAEANPRKQCLLVFKEWVIKIEEEGHILIILTDVNQLLEYSLEIYNSQNL